MPYDPEMDKVLKKWKCEETGLLVSINQYGNGEPKVQIGPRILLKKDGTERAPAKAGRLTIEDISQTGVRHAATQGLRISEMASNITLLVCKNWRKASGPRLKAGDFVIFLNLRLEPWAGWF